MKISELIAQLEQVQSESGDLPVAECYLDRDGYPVYLAVSYTQVTPLWHYGVWATDYASFAGPPNPMLVINGY